MTNRKAKVTEEHLQEAKLLAELWDHHSHQSQAIFGEQFDIGSQSAVGQFLRGMTPLSLKAAAGFAIGLNCKISDFSPRLAKQALTYADLSGVLQDGLDLTQLSKPEAQLVLMFRELTATERVNVLQFVNELRTSAKAQTDRTFPIDTSYAKPIRKRGSVKVVERTTE